jgi:signal peptidase I
MKGLKPFLFELGEVIITALLIVVPIRMFVMSPYFVKGQSMEPNFHNNDYLLVDKLSYKIGDPKRGEVVIFKAPDGVSYYIKRIIGLPGEIIEIQNNTITIFNEEHKEGMVLKEVYLPREDMTTDNIRVTLGEEEYFVMGDNRGASFDSRS